jgi:ferredoxin
MKVHINADGCAGHAQCAAQGPDIYALDDRGYAQQLDGEVPPRLVEQAASGAAACPERAIEIVTSPQTSCVDRERC